MGPPGRLCGRPGQRTERAGCATRYPRGYAVPGLWRNRRRSAVIRRPSLSTTHLEARVIRSSRGAAMSRRMLIAAAIALVPLIAGCEAGTNAPTLHWHPPADGSTAAAGPYITISNVFVLGAPIGSVLEPGQNAGLYMGLVNTGSPDRLLSISAPGVARSVQLPGGGVTLLSQHRVLLTGPQPARAAPGPGQAPDRRIGHTDRADLRQGAVRNAVRAGHAEGVVLHHVLARARADQRVAEPVGSAATAAAGRPRHRRRPPARPDRCWQTGQLASCPARTCSPVRGP